MISFKIQDDKKNTLKITAPDSWAEISLRQLVAIENEAKQKLGLTKLFSILCNTEFESIFQSTDKTLFKKISDVCAFVALPPIWEKLPCPDHLYIGDDRYKVPKNVNKLMHGQIEILLELAREGDLMGIMAELIAVIMYPVIDGKKEYDQERIDVLKEKILESNGIASYGIARFFFRKLVILQSIGRENLKASQKQRAETTKYYTEWLKVEGSTGSELLAEFIQ